MALILTAFRAWDINMDADDFQSELEELESEIAYKNDEIEDLETELDARIDERESLKTDVHELRTRARLEGLGLE